MSRWIATSAVVLIWALFGCAAASVTPRGATVQVVTSEPKGDCKYLGEAVGSQGNFATGDYTSTANLMMGARNRLRSQAADMGGNFVWVQQTASKKSTRSNIGVSNSTVLGNVYRCDSLRSAEKSREDAASIQPRDRL